MAEYLTLPTDNLHIVPDEVPDQDACFAEPLAAACRIAEQQVCSWAQSRVSCSPSRRSQLALFREGPVPISWPFPGHSSPRDCIYCKGCAAIVMEGM